MLDAVERVLNRLAMLPVELLSMVMAFATQQPRIGFDVEGPPRRRFMPRAAYPTRFERRFTRLFQTGRLGYDAGLSAPLQAPPSTRAKIF